MELTGRYELSAPPEVVWTALFDTQVLAAALPGCESLESQGDAAYDATVKLKIGPVSARFKGHVEITDADPHKSCRINGQGNGGVAGFVKGGALVELAPDGDGTVLTYTADAQVGGKLAALGNRLIQTTSRKLADQFFSEFANHLADTQQPVPKALARSSLRSYLVELLNWLFKGGK